MLVDKQSDKNYLILRYYDNNDTVTVKIDTDDGTVTADSSVKFRIYIDDTTLLIDGKDYMEVIGGNGEFINKLIEIPDEVVEASTRTDASTGYNIVSVRFEPYDAVSATVPYRKLYTATGDPENMASQEKELTDTVKKYLSAIKSYRIHQTMTAINMVLICMRHYTIKMVFLRV